MELYLVYEFTHYSYKECRQEEINFFGLHKSKEKALKVANERIRKGIDEYDVYVSKEISNKKNPFSETNCVEMYRVNSDEDSPVYSICIEKFEIERKNENE